MSPRRKSITSLFVASPALGLFLGCGSNAGDLVVQYAEALAQTAVDQWLTELVNDLNGTPIEPDDSDSTPGDGDTGNGDGEPSGDPVQGASIYAANSCGACHCADAGGGCALSAPAIIATSHESIASILVEDSGHPLQPVLSETDIADLEAYLATLIPG